MHTVNAVRSHWCLLLRYTLLHKVQVGFPPSLSLKIRWVTKAQSGSCKHLDSCVYRSSFLQLIAAVPRQGISERMNMAISRIGPSINDEPSKALALLFRESRSFQQRGHGHDS